MDTTERAGHSGVTGGAAVRGDGGPAPEAQPSESRGGTCAIVAPVLARIGDKWSMLVVVLLGPGPRRFNELKRAVDGVSQRMLSLTLRRLERDGLVSRTVTPTVPPRVDYALTALGHSLRLAVNGVAGWAHANHAAMAAAQRRYDASGPAAPEADAGPDQ